MGELTGLPWHPVDDPMWQPNRRRRIERSVRARSGSSTAPTAGGVPSRRPGWSSSGPGRPPPAPAVAADRAHAGPAGRPPRDRQRRPGAAAPAVGPRLRPRVAPPVVAARARAHARLQPRAGRGAAAGSPHPGGWRTGCAAPAAPAPVTARPLRPSRHTPCVHGSPEPPERCGGWGTHGRVGVRTPRRHGAASAGPQGHGGPVRPHPSAHAAHHRPGRTTGRRGARAGDRIPTGAARRRRPLRLRAQPAGARALPAGQRLRRLRATRLRRVPAAEQPRPPARHVAIALSS